MALNVPFHSSHALELRPLWEALPRSSHLRELITCRCRRCSYYGHGGITDALAADVLLPAVRANASLRARVIDGGDGQLDAAREAEALVAARARRGRRGEPAAVAAGAALVAL